MFNVCPNCGVYQIDKQILAEGEEAFAICSTCSHRHPFRRLPLFLLTGACGAGKSTIALMLQQTFNQVITLENDVFPIKAIQQDPIATSEMILRTCKNIQQAGKPVVLAGCNIPQHFEQSIEQRYFSDFYYLALVCSEAELRRRLEARPAWRGFNKEEAIQPQLDINRWFFESYDSKAYNQTLVNTTDLSIEEIQTKVIDWILEHMKS